MAPSAPAEDPAEWREWLKENLLRGVNEHDLVLALAKHGMTPASLGIAPAVTIGLAADAPAPADAADEDGEEAAEVAEPDQLAIEVPRAADLSTEALLHRHLRPRLPVILEDISVGPAITWTPEILWAVFGPETSCVVLFAEEPREVPASWYIEQCVVGRHQGIQLAPHSRLLQSPAAEPLWRELAPDGRYIDLVAAHQHTELVIQPEGTVTDLRCEAVPTLRVQVYGRSAFVLVPPEETSNVYPEGMRSEIDLRRHDPARFPLFEQARRADLEVQPGEALLIPAGWWRAELSLDTMLALDFLDFREPRPGAPGQQLPEVPAWPV